jgi:MFS family permease
MARSVPTTTEAGARADDPRKLSRRWVVALLAATAAVGAGWFGPIQILLPAQATALAGAEGKEYLLVVVTGVGAVVSLVANPIWGLISDRLSATVPRRRPVLVAGVAIGSAGLIVLGLAPDAVWMVVGWVLVQIGLNGPLAALIAMIADRVPEERRGLVGSLFGIAQTVGVVLGTAVAVVLGEGALGYFALAVAVPLLCVAIVLLPERRLPTPGAEVIPETAAPARRPLREVLVALRPTAQFTWAWVVRFLLNLVNALVLTFLYYYLADQVGVDDPGTWVLVLTLVTVALAAIAAGIGGVWSDRIARRRIFVVGAVAATVVGLVILALLPQLEAVIVATVLIGLGWGLFVSVDVAIITHVLPSARSTAGMLGVANIANVLPQAIAPLIAGSIVVMFGGYGVLYLVTAAIALLALPALARLRSVA